MSKASVTIFDGLLIIVGGGNVDLESLQQLAANGGHLVGADGGADTIVAAGLMPEMIIGDFDSVGASDWPETTRLLRIAEQETTDFDKSLYSTQAPVTVAVGMTGGRFDHTLAALDAVTRQAGERKIILVAEQDVIVALRGPFDFAVGAGQRVSVHPVVPIHFSHSEGLVHALDGLTLAPGGRLGSSNTAIDGPFRIVPETDAPWLLILQRESLSALIAALSSS
ncbi:thiamine diphosphokinase [Devosia sp.]|uniref:thiamine diphosphokinase n=1 Tax=Devosia sp. TaxID=1871048 RepID=UPI003A8F1F5E